GAKPSNCAAHPPTGERSASRSLRWTRHKPFLIGGKIQAESAEQRAAGTGFAGNMIVRSMQFLSRHAAGSSYAVESTAESCPKSCPLGSNRFSPNVTDAPADKRETRQTRMNSG